VCKNIYYLGQSGCVNFAGCLRIAGLSGIFKSHHYKTGYFEKMPFNENTVRSVYHVREFEYFKLSKLQDMKKTSKPTVKSTNDSASKPTAKSNNNENNDNSKAIFSMKLNANKKIHIGLSHDWPKGITKYGNEQQLLRWKPDFKQDVSFFHCF